MIEAELCGNAMILLRSEDDGEKIVFVKYINERKNKRMDGWFVGWVI